MTYMRWLSVIENLPINPEGNAEERNNQALIKPNRCNATKMMMMALSTPSLVGVRSNAKE
jgi:hypothetical protein